ncbi:MAG: 4-hydroxy-tetrahydrodipicolinate synthase [Selenomonadaceae bacterium]|nr:4-hydroxy-tetrahydrodipicolinate synthase [Selenomonadaceae bacterium]
MKPTIFRGAGVAIATPFSDGGINFSELGRLIDFQIDNGTDAIIITGTTGESATMSDEEHRAAIKFAVDHVKKKIPVIAGTGSNETAYAISLSKFAAEVGADALLCVTPYYNKCTQKGLVKHFEAIADSTDLPVILYNVPSRTGVNISIDAYRELSKHPRINATKEANGDLTSVLRTRYACGDDLNIYSGNDDQTLAILSLGGLGVISVLSNIMPRQTHELCKNFFDGDLDGAQRLQIKLCDLIDALFCEVNPIPVKTALRLIGFEMGELRMPLSEMEEKNLERLKSALKNHGLI